MDSPETHIAKTELRVAALEKLQDVYAWIPRAVAELVQWKIDQNGDIREIKDDIREMKDTMADLTISHGRRVRRASSRDRWLKWGLGACTFISVVCTILVAIHVI